MHELPLSILRTLLPGIARSGRRWPRVLRNKWGAIALVVILLWAYEWLDLWANPWLTAWLAVGYFVAAFALELAFKESPFCKYLCPLGAFNTTYATLSPLQIASRDRDVCRACANHECVNGSATVPGCGTELFVPQIESNIDCLLCLDCARACPYNNVALKVRRPAGELGVHPWRKRWDIALLALILAFSGVSNAFGMVPPIYALESTLSGWLSTDSEAIILLLIFGIGNVALPIGLGLLAAATSRRLTGEAEPLRFTLARYAPVFVPLGFAVWLGHYTFHFATGASDAGTHLAEFCARPRCIVARQRSQLEAGCHPAIDLAPALANRRCNPGLVSQPIGIESDRAPRTDPSARALPVAHSAGHPGPGRGLSLYTADGDARNHPVRALGQARPNQAPCRAACPCRA